MIKNIISTLFTKGFVAIINLAILLISSKLLGVDVRGQISLLILNLAIIQIITEIYTGYTLVYFIPRFSLIKIYRMGVVWTIISVIVSSALLLTLFLVFKIGENTNWIHLFALSIIIISHSFHMVILLAKEKIKAYNFLNFYQPTVLLTALLICIYFLGIFSVYSYIIALYVSFCSSFLLSAFQVFKLFKTAPISEAEIFEPKQILKNGFLNQLANLTHMLSNRYNFYLLGSTILVGVYSSATSLIESVWIISGSVTPIILTFIANSTDSTKNSNVTFLLAKICFLLSVVCVGVLLFIPDEFFTYILGKDFSSTKNIMLHLSPGVIVISFSSIISHYFSGLGKQNYLVLANVAGFITTILFAQTLINQYQLIGACYAACLSYFVAATILTILFMTKNKLNFTSLFRLKKDINHLQNI